MGNKELQQQENKPFVIGEENRLAVAISSKIIREASFEEVKESLRFVMLKIGLRAQNLPTDIEKLILYEHIVNNFGGNRVEEIKLAFEMAIAGKLNLEDIKCYENFSCAYLSMIMIAYQKWAAQAYKFIEQSDPPPQKIFSQQELDDSAREDAERQYQLFLKGHDLRGLEINKAILEKDNLIKREETVYDFFKRWLGKGFPNIYKPA